MKGSEIVSCDTKVFIKNNEVILLRFTEFTPQLTFQAGNVPGKLVNYSKDFAPRPYLI